MITRHIQILQGKYQSLTKHLRTLIKTGRYASLSLSRRLSLTKRWHRYHVRMGKWRPQAISGLGIGLYMVLTSSTCHHFTLSPVLEPFGITDVGYFSTPTFADIDGDGDLDAFVGETGGNINFFKNIGTPSAPNFSMSGGASPLGLSDVGAFSAPTFADIDGDGDLDAFVGDGDGDVNFFKNNGTAANANFVLQTETIGFANYGPRTIPTFADIDGDGDLEAFVSRSDGTIGFLENISTSSGIEFETTGMPAPFGLTDRSARVALTFTDIDGDGDLDAFAGEGSGKTVFFRNNGSSTSADFELIPIDSPFGISDVGSQSAPTFADIDGDGDLDAFVGAEDGLIKFFAGTVGIATFELSSDVNILGLTDGPDIRSTPTFADVDGDGDWDLFVGDDEGDIRYFQNIGSPMAAIFQSVAIINPFGFSDVGIHSAPTFADIDGDGDLDAFIGKSDGKINFFRNGTTSASGSFSLDTASLSPFGLSDVGGVSVPTFVDIDGDGDLDAFVGEGAGNINFFRNDGSSNLAFFSLSPSSTPFGLIDIGGFASPAFADIDGDGDLDIFVGDSNGHINFFSNTGSNTSASFVLSTNTTPFGLTDIGGFAAPAFVDIDADGDLDAFIGARYGDISFFENQPCKSSHNVNHVQLAQNIFITQDELTSRAVIRNGRDATFSAATGIALDTLFEVQQGAVFMGIMDGCPIE